MFTVLIQQCLYSTDFDKSIEEVRYKDPYLAKYFVRVRNNDSTLSVLDLHNAFMSTKETKVLAEALKSNSTVKKLDLQSNSIRDEGSAALAEALEVNGTLTALKLSVNDIKDEGVKALAAALKKNKALTTLLLVGNDIGIGGIKALADMLKQNKTLTELNLANVNIGNEGAKALAVSLTKNKALVDLELGSCSIGTEGSAALIKALENNATLTKLDLSENNVAESARMLLETLKRNITITEIALSLCRVEFDLIEQIFEFFERNRKLPETQFMDNMKVIMQTDKSTVKEIPVEIWGVVASYLGYPEDFAINNLPDLLEEFKKENMQSLLQNIRQKLEKRAFWLSLRSSKMGPGSIGEDLSSISNEDSPKSARLRAVYEQEPEEVKKEFSFHRWLKMKSSFYDQATRGQNSKPSFEEWLSH